MGCTVKYYRSCDVKNHVIICLPLQVSLSQSLVDNDGKLTWQKCSDIPAGVSSATAVKDNNGIIYIGGGWVGDAERLSSLTTYNPHTSYWSTLPPCPVQYGRLATVTEKDVTKLIVVGGILEADWKTTSTLFTREGGKWREQYPCMSVPRLTPAVSVYNNKYLIVAGGSGRDHNLDSIEVLELEKKQWYNSLVKLPHAMAEVVSSIAGDDLIVMGTQDDDAVTNSNNCSIVSIPINAILGEAPVTMTTLPPPPLQHCTLVQNISPPLLLGGCSDTGESPGVFVYCSDSNNWKHVGTTSCNRANATSIVLHNYAILLFGGTQDAKACKNTVISSVEVCFL